jgi:DNA-binding beta-propeller fold protein YncE
MAGPPITLPNEPNPVSWALAVTGNSKTVYALANGPGNSPGFLIPVNTATTAVGKPIPVGQNSNQIVIAPTGAFAFVLNEGLDGQGAPDGGTLPKVTGTITPINTTTNKAGKVIKVGLGADAIAVAK